MKAMRQAKPIESTPFLGRDGYAYIQNRSRELDTDVFEARILLQKTICMTGEAAARLFYDETLFQRKGAAPRRMKKTLLGEGSVQGLDGEAHRTRKAMFMSLMDRQSIDRLAELVRREWESAISAWKDRPSVTLLDEVQQIHARAVCAWAGVPLEESEVEIRTEQLIALIESPGRIGPVHWQGRKARRQAEAWCRGLVDRLRSGRLQAKPGQALGVIALHKEADGRLLDRQTAAVELLNILRPTVAVARYVTFAALALHQHPAERERIAAGDDAYIPLFIQEVRRYYPFFPFAVARVKKDFAWRGYHFPKGRRALLDLYGITHDPRLWEDPERFYPERFQGWKENAFTLVPQGGSDHHHQHRCAGEWITLSLMATAVRMLTHKMKYRVPEQDLRIKLNWVPAAPESRFVIDCVRQLN